MRSAATSPPPPSEPFSQPASPAPSSGAAAASAASASCSSGSSAIGASDRPAWRLVDQHLLDQHAVDLGGGDDQVHPPLQLGAQRQRALAARKVLGPELAQEGLEDVLQARHLGVEGVGGGVVGKLEGELQLQEGRL